ncbi:hypothetical protein Trydic_g567 [Trypoxylus dichotomus]
MLCYVSAKRIVSVIHKESYRIMDHDDEEGVGFIAESHYAKAASEDRQAAVSLLQGPIRQSKDNLTGPKRNPATGVTVEKDNLRAFRITWEIWTQSSRRINGTTFPRRRPHLPRQKPTL